MKWSGRCANSPGPAEPYVRGTDVRDLTCAECGVGYTVTHNRRSMFCSEQCRWRANERKRRGRTRGQRVCDWCGRTYQQTGHEQRSCSFSCTAALKWVGRSVPIPWRSCHKCGSYYTTRSGRPCSCPPWISRGALRSVSCHNCGVTWEAPARQGPHACEACRQEAKRRERRAERARRRRVHHEPYTPESIFDRDRWRCQICRRVVKRTATVPHPRAPTIDHILPISKGGADVPANVQCAHFECNWRKADGGTDQLRLLG